MITTDYEIGQDNVTRQLGPFGLDIHNPVFMISGLTIVAFVFLTLAFQQQTDVWFGALRSWLTSNLDWFFIIAGNIFVLFCLLLIVLPVGSVRLGGAEARPDFGYAGWFAMLFAAGMGIGLMFFGVLEPVYHMAVSEPLGIPPAFVDGAVAPGNADVARDAAMAATIYHWGLHPWAIYAVVALALALFSYNKGLPLTIRSVFYPIFGERVWGWPGHIIDTLAVFATLFGLATSLGLGAQQAASGLTFLFGTGVAEEGTRAFLGIPYDNTAESGVADSNVLLVLLILGITAVALVSVYRGLEGGVKRLSEINMALAGLLLLFVIFVGPTALILTGFFDNIVDYGAYLLPLSNPFGREDDAFREGWTSFYWAWWISWSPFVGMFIARVSRGRTVREFIIAVLIVPSVVSVLWMTAFGGTAIEQVLTQDESAVRQYVIDSYSPELSLFGMLSELPLATITSFVAIVLVIVFFVTSSDSGSLVIDTITAGGKVDAPLPQRMFWATFEGLVAIALLLGGGLVALQAMAVSTGFPFAIVLLLVCWCVWRGLHAEPRS